MDILIVKIIYFLYVEIIAKIYSKSSVIKKYLNIWNTMFLVPMKKMKRLYTTTPMIHIRLGGFGILIKNFSGGVKLHTVNKNDLKIIFSLYRLQNSHLNIRCY